MIKVKQNLGIREAKCPLCKEAGDTQYHLLTCPSLSIPQPWNIQSVESALRQRETILEREKENSENLIRNKKEKEKRKNMKNIEKELSC